MKLYTDTVSVENHLTEVRDNAKKLLKYECDNSGYLEVLEVAKAYQKEILNMQTRNTDKHFTEFNEWGRLLWRTKMLIDLANDKLSI